MTHPLSKGNVVVYQEPQAGGGGAGGKMGAGGVGYLTLCSHPSHMTVAGDLNQDGKPGLCIFN